MDTEEYVLVLGLLLIVASLLYPSEAISGTFCEGSSGELGSYSVGVQNGFLRVYHRGEEALVAKGDRVLLKRENVEYSYSENCYRLVVKEKPEEALYIFVLGVVLIGVAFYYMLFLKYR